ncbi:hypothetical protein KAH27_05075, partial [bacterium]|nr:hypothetical protein [bacterium]
YYNAMPSTPAVGSAVKVIDSKDDMDYICRTYKLKTKGISAELASYLRTTVEKEKGKVDVSVDTNTGVEYIVITAPIFQFTFLGEMIKSLDHPGTKFWEDGTTTASYKLKNRLASDISDFVREVLLSKDGSVYADNGVNKIYIGDSPSYFNATMDFIKEFDVPPEMVRIEAEIIEIEGGENFNFGLALEAWKEALPEEVNMDIDWEEDKTGGGGGPSGWGRQIAQSIQINGMRPKAVANFINYLVRTGKAKVLSRPTIVAMNGEEGIIASQDTISYVSYSSAEEPLHKQTEIGLVLKIKPIIASETISLNIDAAIRSLIGYSGNGEPIINNRATTANIVLKSGELFTLSGLRKDTITKSNSGVPILQKIPLLGYFFRHEIDVRNTKEIVIFLTPKKVTSSTSVMEREKELISNSKDVLAKPPRTPMEKFSDRVIYNKID